MPPARCLTSLWHFARMRVVSRLANQHLRAEDTRLRKLVSELRRHHRQRRKLCPLAAWGVLQLVDTSWKPTKAQSCCARGENWAPGLLRPQVANTSTVLQLRLGRRYQWSSKWPSISGLWLVENEQSVALSCDCDSCCSASETKHNRLRALGAGRRGLQPPCIPSVESCRRGSNCCANRWVVWFQHHRRG